MRKEWLSVVGGLLSAAGSRGQKGSVEKRKTVVGSNAYDYQLYAPANAENENDLPVIIFLHGIGQRGSGGFVPNEGPIGALVRHYFSQVPALVLLPQCRPGVYWSDSNMEQMTMQALENTIKEFSADEKRVYLTGVSMGGYGVWSLAMNHPKIFAGLVSICGGSPIMTGERFAPIAEKVEKTPAWLFHGAEDRVVPASESRGIVEAINARQGNVKYSEYAGVGHDVWLKVVSEKSLMPWLLAQKTG